MSAADPLATTRFLLEQSALAATKGRESLDRAVALRAQAFTTLPVGAVLVWASTLIVFAVSKTVDGWTCSTGDSPTAEWIAEQWERGNWKIVEDAL